jgi:cytochrome d ubiquinol oxidase subunit I
MVGIGFLFIFMAGAGGILWLFRKLDRARLYLLALRWCWPLGFVAIIAGWTTTEVGRQPWVAHGVLRTADAASHIPAISIAVFIALFVLVYGVVFGAGIRYIRRLIKQGPGAKPADEPEILANRPISAALEEGQSAGNVAIALQRAE